MIGWYVHHHGWGHLTRMQAVRPHLREQVTVFSSLPAPRILPARFRPTGRPDEAEPSAYGRFPYRPHTLSSPTVASLPVALPLCVNPVAKRLGAGLYCPEIAPKSVWPAS